MNQPSSYVTNTYQLPPTDGTERGLDYVTGKWIRYQPDSKPTQEKLTMDSIRIEKAKARAIRDKEIEDYLEREHPEILDYWGDR